MRIVCRIDAGADGFSPDHFGTREIGARAEQRYVRFLAQRRFESRNRTRSSAKAARELFPTGNFIRRLKIQNISVAKFWTEFVEAGANPEILYINKPHIGTYKLVMIVEKMRATIESLGGEIRFQSRVENIEIENNKVRGVNWQAANLSKVRTSFSPSDTARAILFEMLFERGVYIEPKPFSIGFRIEHPQNLIDECRFGDFAGNKLLGAADYKLVHHCKNGRSVYSFCMCPGGMVVAAASEAGKLVTNGMSQYSRSEKNANSAIVVGITPEKDYPENALAGIELQRRLEEKAFKLGGENYNAPGQLGRRFSKRSRFD